MSTTNTATVRNAAEIAQAQAGFPVRLDEYADNYGRGPGAYEDTSYYATIADAIEAAEHNRYEQASLAYTYNADGDTWFTDDLTDTVHPDQLADEVAEAKAQCEADAAAHPGSVSWYES